MNLLKKLLPLLMILAIALTMLFSCELQEKEDDVEDDPIIDEPGGNDPDDKEPVKTTLSTPKVTVNGATASWTAIVGATGYEIYVDGNIITVGKTVLSYTATANCEIKVRALGDGETTITGTWSSKFSLEVSLPTLATPSIIINGEKAVWTTVSGAVGYEIELNGAFITLDSSVYSYTLASGDTIRVRALADGVSYATSGWSEKISLDGVLHSHSDDDKNEKCDSCGISVVVTIDFYAINDLHGKFCDTDKQPGVDELGTYLSNAKKTDDYTIFLSSGDMWQGSAESNLTGGFILTEWMNEMGFVSMTLGNHEFDWGEQVIKNNLAVADFPFLAINIYDNATGERVDYCDPSIIVDFGDFQVGIIGAIGNCYSSISADRVEGIHFKTGDALTRLIKDESKRLTDYGVDFIALSLHDGSSGIDTYALKDYIDIVFEGHTHSAYSTLDSNGIYHLQGGGENNGITHAEIRVNFITGEYVVNTAEVVTNSKYSSLADDEKTEAIEDKYQDVIDEAYTPLGIVSSGMYSNDVEDYVAGLYLEAALKKWGDKYDIVLGGGYLKTRSPYDLPSGEICYADILSIFPFDNRLVLCSIPGSTLKSRFINPTGDYHSALSEYGKSIQNNIDTSKTYYVIVDTYTQLYAANNLTAVEYYDDNVYARDLLADAIREGRLDNSQSFDEYTTTDISDLLEIGKGLSRGEETSEYYFVEGTIVDAPQGTYGNLYLTDGAGNTIYVYGVYDKYGNKYGSMSEKPTAGDKVVLYSKLYNYYDTSAKKEILELKNAVLVEIVK